MPGADAFVAREAGVEDVGRTCAICQCQISASERVGPCPSCSATFHEECWSENGGCAVYGCPQAPQTVKPTEGALPQSHWGQEEKTCPNCRNRIKVAAIRCRFCGTMFDSAAPMTRGEMLQARQRKSTAESLKGSSLVVFICGIIPCLAPLTLIVGGLWYLINRREIGRLPSMSRVYCYVGLLASLFCTLLIVLALVLI